MVKTKAAALNNRRSISLKSIICNFEWIWWSRNGVLLILLSRRVRGISSFENIDHFTDHFFSFISWQPGPPYLTVTVSIHLFYLATNPSFSSLFNGTCMWRHSFHTFMVVWNSVEGSVCNTAWPVITPSDNYEVVLFARCSESVYAPNSSLLHCMTILFSD